MTAVSFARPVIVLEELNSVHKPSHTFKPMFDASNNETKRYHKPDYTSAT